MIVISACGLDFSLFKSIVLEGDFGILPGVRSEVDRIPFECDQVRVKEIFSNAATSAQSDLMNDWIRCLARVE